MLDDSFALGVWQHVVVSAEGATMRVHVDGVLAGSTDDGHEPLVLQRTQHWLGRSAYSADGFFRGRMAYLRVWHGGAIGEEEVKTLYDEREYVLT